MVIQNPIDVVEFIEEMLKIYGKNEDPFADGKEVLFRLNQMQDGELKKVIIGLFTVLVLAKEANEFNLAMRVFKESWAS